MNPDDQVSYRVTDAPALDRYDAAGRYDVELHTLDFLGPVDGEGFPVPGHDLYDRTIKIRVRAFDVDFDGDPNDPSRLPERNYLEVNGQRLDGFYRGSNNQWGITTFEVSANHVRFPADGFNIGENTITIGVDENDAGWRVETDWIELVTFGQRPLVTLHGITGGPGDFSTQPDGPIGFAEWLNINASRDAIPWGVGQDNTAAGGPDERKEYNGELYRGIQNIQFNQAALNRQHQALAGFGERPRFDAVVHSMGGLNMRQFITLNPDAVGQLIMLATPNGGSELADGLCKGFTPEGGLGWLGTMVGLLDDNQGACEDATDAQYQLQTWYVEDIFNPANPDNPHVEYIVAAGDRAQIPSGHLNGQDDGAVTVDSVTYNVRNGTHRTMRGSSFPETHSSIKTSEAVFENILCTLNRTCIFGRTGASDATTFSSATRAAQPASNDRRQLIGLFRGAVDGAERFQILADGAHGVTVYVAAENLAALRGTLGGVAMVPLEEGPLPSLISTVAAPGETVDLVVTSDVAQTVGVMVFGTNPDHTIGLNTQTIARPGVQSVPFTSWTGAAPSAVVQGPDGDAVDVEVQVGADGAGTVEFAGSPGLHRVTISTEQPRRSVSAGVNVTAPDALLGEELTGDRFVTDPDGATYLEVDVPVDASQPADWRLTGRLSTAAGPAALATSTATLEPGTRTIPLRFDAAHLLRAGADGPWTLTDVSLSRVTATEAALTDLADSMGQTSSSMLPNAASGVEFDRQSFDDSLTVDDTGATLALTFDVLSTEPGTHFVNGDLLDRDGETVAELTGSFPREGARTPVSLATAVDLGVHEGPFTVADLTVYDSDSEFIDFLEIAHATGPYTADAPDGISRPAVTDDFVHGVAGEPLIVAPLSNDSDDDGFATGRLRITNPSLGVATAHPDRTVTFASDIAGTTSFTYLACDIYDNCSPGTVNVTISDRSAPSEPEFPPSDTDTGRIGPDGDPVEAAISAAQQLIPDSALAQTGDRPVDRVVVARDDVFADTLGASPLLGHDTPLLYVPGGPLTPLPEIVGAELDRLMPGGGDVVIVGGPLAVSDAVAIDIEERGHAVQRIFGPSRVETSVAIAKTIDQPGEVLVARADGWVDAITAGAYAAFADAPVVLTPTDEALPAVHAYLDDREVDVVVVGGTAAVSDSTFGQVDADRRVAGPARAETAIAVATDLWDSPAGIQLVNGYDDLGWAFALIGVAHAAGDQAAQVLVDRNGPPEPTRQYLDANPELPIRPVGPSWLAPLP